MKALVTGAAGFVGTNLCRYLGKNGISFRRSVRRHDGANGETVVVGDIDENTDWSQALEGVEVVVHLAARVHIMRERASDPLVEFRKVNVFAALNLAQQAAEAGVRRFVYLSTIKVNGEETGEQPFRADDPPAPQDSYGMSKMEAEEGLFRIGRRTGMEVVIIRPPLVYGKGAGGNFSRLVGLVKKGWFLPFALIKNKRSLVGMENLCSLITLCLTHPAAANRVWLVSDGEDVSTPQLVKLIARSCGVPARIFPAPVWMLRFLAKMTGKGAEMSRLIGDLQVDSSQTRSLLQWQPPLSLIQGIEMSVGAGE